MPKEPVQPKESFKMIVIQNGKKTVYERKPKQKSTNDES